MISRDGHVAGWGGDFCVSLDYNILILGLVKLIICF